MVKEDINIVFAAGIAIVMLIISAISKRQEDRKLVKAQMQHDNPEHKQDQVIE